MVEMQTYGSFYDINRANILILLINLNKNEGEKSRYM